MALIELSPETPAPPAPAAPPPAYFYRRFGLALAALLVLALGGAAPASSLLWERVGAVPMPPGGDFQLRAGRVYTMDLDAHPRVLTAWQADPVRRLWSYAGAATRDPFFVRDATADLALLQTGRSVTVLDARTGAVRWTSPHPVLRLTDGLALVQKENFRPGTEYDPESGDPGRLYGKTSDTLHTEPALSTEIHGVELATGVPRWSVTMPGSVFTAWTGAPTSVLVVLSADKLTLRSPTTGAVLRERAVPRIDGQGPAEGEVVGHTVLVHYGDFGAGGRVTAYALDTLEERWRQNRPDPAGSAVDCVGLLCARSREGLTVLDPRTGSARWRVTDTDVLAFGDRSALEMRAPNVPVRTADVATGRPQVELAGWNALFPVDDRDAYLLARAEQDRDTVFGLLLPDRAEVLPLGRLPGVTHGCQPVPGLVACQVGNRLELWAYLRG